MKDQDRNASIRRGHLFVNVLTYRVFNALSNQYERGGELKGQVIAALKPDRGTNTREIQQTILSAEQSMARTPSIRTISVVLDRLKHRGLIEHKKRQGWKINE